MKFKTKLGFAVAAAAISLLGLTSQAKAGQGGAAAAASFSLDTNQHVTGAAVAAAVGKNDAAATANNQNSSYIYNTTYNTATALGSAGLINTTTEGSGYTSLNGSTDTQITQAQANDLTPKTGVQYINVSGTAGTVTVGN